MTSNTFALKRWLAITAAVALALTFSRMLTLHTADSLIYTLASLDHWTAFFWEQDRVGLLIPLVTSPITHPLANLLTQTFLMTWAGLLLPVLLARLVLPTAAGALAACVANAWFLALAPDLLHENQFVVCMYPTGLCLGLSGLILLEQKGQTRLGTALVLMMLAMWVYLGVVVVLAPLAVMHGWRRRSVHGIGVVIAGFAAGFALMKSLPLPPYEQPTPNVTLPLAEWPASARMFVTRVADAGHGGIWLGVCAAALVLGFVVNISAWQRMLPAIVVLAAAACEVGTCATRMWVADNLHHPRYVVFTLTALPLAAAMLVIMPLSFLLNARFQQLPMIGFVLLMLCAWLRHEPVMNPRRLVDEQFGHHSEAVLIAACPAFGAKYWDLWTTFFHLRMVTHERGGAMPFPVGWRTWAYRDAWRSGAAFRIAVLPGAEGELALEMLRRGLDPPTTIDEADGIVIAMSMRR